MWDFWIVYKYSNCIQENMSISQHNLSFIDLEITITYLEMEHNGYILNYVPYCYIEQVLFGYFVFIIFSVL